MGLHRCNMGILGFIVVGSSFGCLADTIENQENAPDVQTVEQSQVIDPGWIPTPMDSIRCLDSSNHQLPSCNFTGPPPYRVEFNTPSIPLPHFESWKLPTGSRVVSGCGMGNNACTVDLNPSCEETHSPSTNTTQITVEDYRTVIHPYVPNAKYQGTVTIPFPSGCRLTACTAPPGGTPVLGIQSEFCRGLHTSQWTAVSGADWYEGQAKAQRDLTLGIGPTTPWEVIPPGHSYPGVWLSTSETSCFSDSSTAYSIRVRACNACGCSPWSFPALFTPWVGPCA